MYKTLPKSKLKKLLLTSSFGLLFVTPFSILILIPSLLAFQKFKNLEKSRLKKNILSSSFYCFIFFFPLVVSVNIFSSFMFPDFNAQSVVQNLLISNNIRIEQIISIVFISPFIEELYFRGLLFDQLRSLFGIFISIIITSLYFSFIHLNIISLPTLFTLGIVLALFKIISGNVYLSIFIHMFFNLFMLSMILF